MMRHSLAALLCAAAVLVPSTTAAQSRTRGIMRLGGDVGGDKVLEFTYDDGSTPDVPAGAGLLFSGGVVIDTYRAAKYSVETQLTIGIKARTIPPAENQDATWLRFPLEGLVFVKATPSFRMGGGMTMHLANTLKASGAVLNDKVTFKATPGFMLQAEYLRNDLGFDVRITRLNYEVQGGGSGTVDASSIGGGLTYFFKRKS